MKDWQYYGIIGTVWVASYDPTLFNPIFGTLVLAFSIYCCIKDR